MKMNEEKAVCCSECFHYLALISPSCASLWTEFCDLHLANGLFGVVMQESICLQILEQHGFLISTDTEDYTIVKVLGQQLDEENNIYYCCKGCDV